MSHTRTLLAPLVLLALALSCAAPEPPPPPPPMTVENGDLGVIISSLPESFAVAVNEGAVLQLRPADELTRGVLSFEVSPELHSVNLVAAVTDHQAAIEALPEGQYQGAQELKADFGVAFYSRGRFVDDGAPTEETIVVLIHKTGNRMLTLRYRYPAANDSAQRVEQLIDVLSRLE